MPTAKDLPDSEVLLAHSVRQHRSSGESRTRNIYIAEDVYWCLSMRAKALEGCADQFADELLRIWCQANLPELWKLREQRDRLWQQQKDIDSEAAKVAGTNKP